VPEPLELPALLLVLSLPPQAASAPIVPRARNPPITCRRFARTSKTEFMS
jgi:hypothetical protein